jgi:DNA-directed RNA polymerase specialized sigma24 family protein
MIGGGQQPSNPLLLTPDLTRPTVIEVDRAAALDELPESHAVALRLRDAGHDSTAIATALGIEIASVEPLLWLAEAKLERLLQRQ